MIFKMVFQHQKSVLSISNSTRTAELILLLRVANFAGILQENGADIQWFNGDMKMNVEEIKFHIGDFVKDRDGRIGYIADICKCSECKKRGFFEPIVKYMDNSVDYISNYQARHLSNNYKQIGAQCFDTIEKEIYNHDWHKISESIPDRCGVYDVKFKNCLGGTTETRALYKLTSNGGFGFCISEHITNRDVIEWRYENEC